MILIIHEVPYEGAVTLSFDTEEDARSFLLKRKAFPAFNVEDYTIYKVERTISVIDFLKQGAERGGAS